MTGTLLLAAEGGGTSILPEETLRTGVDFLVRLVEAAGALVIFVGAAYAFLRFVIAGFTARNAEAFVPVRLSLGRFLALGLEFQLASDVLSTAIAPTFNEIGKLAAIAAIRTALNYFLAKEIREESETVAALRARGVPSAADQATSQDPAIDRTDRAGRTGRVGARRADPP